MKTKRKRICALLLTGALAALIPGCVGSPGQTSAIAETPTAAETPAAATEGAAEAESEPSMASDAAESTAAADAPASETEDTAEETMRIKVEANGNEIIFELNNSQASKELYDQLPLTVENEDFSNNEKTFYPPSKLDTSGAPMTDGSVGTLAYYGPWGDVVLFYGSFQPNGSLYELGKAVSGQEQIQEITGEMTISPEQ